MNNSFNNIANAAAAQLEKSAGCSFDQARQVVSITCGNLIKQAEYADLRKQKNSHETALSWVRSETGVRAEETPAREAKHLLACLIEECGKVQQLAGRSLNAPKNWPELAADVHDLVAVYQLLCNAKGVGGGFNSEMIRAKKKRTIEQIKLYGVLK